MAEDITETQVITTKKPISIGEEAVDGSETANRLLWFGNTNGKKESV